MNVGDEITVNGKIVGVIVDKEGQILGLQVETKSGRIISIKECDVNTIHPYMPIPEKDQRTGS